MCKLWLTYASIEVEALFLDIWSNTSFWLRRPATRLHTAPMRRACRKVHYGMITIITLKLITDFMENDEYNSVPVILL